MAEGKSTLVWSLAWPRSFQRLPVENGYHTGTITTTQDGIRLLWTNASGVSWHLQPAVRPAAPPGGAREVVALNTGPDCPYFAGGRQGCGEFRLLLRQTTTGAATVDVAAVAPSGFWFMEEFYECTAAPAGGGSNASSSSSSSSPCEESRVAMSSEGLFGHINCRLHLPRQFSWDTHG